MIMVVSSHYNGWLIWLTGDNSICALFVNVVVSLHYNGWLIWLNRNSAIYGLYLCNSTLALPWPFMAPALYRSELAGMELMSYFGLLHLRLDC